MRDPVSSASHLLTAAWAAYAAVVLLRLTPPTRGQRISVSVFGASMVFLYLASGVYHAVPFSPGYRPDALRFLQTLDRSAIFVLIAGTNTPVMVSLLASPWRRWCLWSIWGLAAAGVATLWAFPQPPFGLAVGMYVAMGWLGLVPLAQYLRAVGWRGMSWAALGGVLYTAGAVCDLTQWPVLTAGPVRVGPHEVFHLATVGGSVAFYVFVAGYVVPYAPPSATAEGGGLVEWLDRSPAASGMSSGRSTPSGSCHTHGSRAHRHSGGRDNPGSDPTRTREW